MRTRVAILASSEGRRPSDSPTHSLARRFAGALRSRGSLAAARSRTFGTLLVLTAMAGAVTTASPARNAAETEAWRLQREKDLKSETGWLTVAGLVFLKPGANTVGADPGSDVLLPAAAPKHAGRLVRDADAVWFEPQAGAGLTLDGAPVTARVQLKPQDRLVAGTVSFHLHQSGDRLGVRIRDVNSELRHSFKGLRWFPVRDQWIIDARFVPYDAPRAITVANILGDFERLTVPGDVVFTVNGAEQRLQAAQAGRRLWLIFSDARSGRDTYRIRFLYVDAPGADGRVTLDFNRAYNPPCAYNPYTTCPVPPPQNRLRIGIDAGERIPNRAALIAHR